MCSSTFNSTADSVAQRYSTAIQRQSLLCVFRVSQSQATAGRRHCSFPYGHTDLDCSLLQLLVKGMHVRTLSAVDKSQKLKNVPTCTL